MNTGRGLTCRTQTLVKGGFIETKAKRESLAESEVQWQSMAGR